MPVVKAIIVFSCLTGFLLLYQNCGNNMSSIETRSESSQNSADLVPALPINSQPKSCFFDGLELADGEEITAFLASTVPSGQSCSSQEEIRVCRDGALSGSYMFSTCAVNRPASCLFNGMSIESGSQVSAFLTSSVPFGQSCAAQSQNRVCNNGVLSGNYSFATCAANAPASCLFNGATVADGAAVAAYMVSSVPFGQSCSSVQQSRVCANGALSGNFAFGSCTVNAPASCIFNGLTINSGTSVPAFSASTVPFGQSCSAVQQSRMCTNGVLSGNFTFGSCAVDAPTSCLFNGLTVVHGATVTAFQSSSVPFGQSCSALQETRTCSNGKLSGSHAFASCVVNPEVTVQPAVINIDSPTTFEGDYNYMGPTAELISQLPANTKSFCNSGSVDGTMRADGSPSTTADRFINNLMAVCNFGNIQFNQYTRVRSTLWIKGKLNVVGTLVIAPGAVVVVESGIVNIGDSSGAPGVIFIQNGGRLHLQGANVYVGETNKAQTGIIFNQGKVSFSQ